MKIKLVFHGSLRRYNSGAAEMVLEIADGNTVADLMSRVGVPQEELAFVAINGSRATASQIIQPGDEVKFFQLVAGG
ncbi:MAG: MoaD/ThiS family protein [candidate division KSB1 bacterium]|nr:MoaD/ThiS family protein [candidate division KSB1 bacterium]MDZ7318538.1 MoaD/ThiS family protein [candidate division KSB1 bacterium]MDZ7342305.1 MoaD/ThiS family protein [candidate division KSB1 bacterium]